jgi:acyl-CoA synthetase (AMP-forming)/AMP-acid ligase II
MHRRSTKGRRATSANRRNAMAVDYEFNVGTAFARVAGQHRDAPALKLADGAYVSYDALNRSANAVAAMLTRRGISRGDVVAIVHTKWRDDRVPQNRRALRQSR